VKVLPCTDFGNLAGVAAGVDWVTGDHAAGTPAVANTSLGAAGTNADGITYSIASGNSNGADACNFTSRDLHIVKRSRTAKQDTGHLHHGLDASTDDVAVRSHQKEQHGRRPARVAEPDDVPQAGFIPLRDGGYIMERLRLPSRGLAAFFALSAILLTAAPPAQAADTLPPSTQELPVASIYQMVRSAAGDRVYIATGTDEVLVADLAGHVVARIGGLPHNHGLDVAPDGTLWVAMPDDREIASVDPVSLTVRTRYPVPAKACPGDVAVTGRFVAFGFSCFFFTSDNSGSNDSGVGVLDTANGAVSLLDQYLTRPIVATSPALPDRVYTVDYNSHSTALALLDVSSGTPQRVTSHYLLNESVFDLAVSPDGQTVAIATFFDNVESFAAADLAPSTVYQLDCNGLSLGWRSDSAMLSVGCNHHTDVYQVAVFARGVPAPALTIPLYGTPERLPIVQAMVMTPDYRSVLVATQARFEYRAFLEPIGLRPSSLSVSGPATAIVTQPVSLSATLVGDGAPAPAGIPLDIAREDPATGAVTPLGTVYTSTGGVATFTDTPPAGGTVRYSARLGAHPTLLPAYGSDLVDITKLSTAISVTFEAGKQRKGVLPGTIIVTLGPTGDERLVMITATTAAGTQTVTVAPVPVSGPLRLPYSVGERTTLTASYQGNSVQAPATASVDVAPTQK
jgi:hypothetical protein